VLAKAQPVACTPGRFVVTKPTTGLTGAVTPPALDVIEYQTGTLTLAGCGPTSAKVKATKKGTLLSAKWTSCPAVKGKALLTATIRAPDCRVIKGTLRTPKAKPKKRSFIAERSTCGDGKLDLEGAEQCEPPATATCTATCQRIASCGDGVVTAPETCDDGNTTDCDGCRADCGHVDHVCGDGIPECGEECDDGNGTANDGCDPNCTLSRCGNGVLNPGEACDDGNLDNLDGCTVLCRAEVAPPFVKITSPASGTVTGQHPITVTGLVQPGITSAFVRLASTTTSLPVTITGTTFSVGGIFLQEGRNVLTLTGTHTNGQIGSDSATIVFDTTPPTVIIESPRAGAFVAAPAVEVAGLVNDIAPGVVNGEDVSVSVNGISATVVAGTFSIPSVALTPGLNLLAARAVDRAGNVATKTFRVTRRADGVGMRLVLLSGGNQSALPGSVLAPLRVRLLDALGTAVPRVGVRFRVSRGDGTFGDGGRDQTVTTDANGEAGIGYRLGSRAGVGLHRITVDSEGAGELEVCETAVRGGPTSIGVAGGNNQTATAGGGVPAPFVAIARDAQSNPVPGARITFQRETGTGGFEGGAVERTLVTNDDGRASVTYVAGTSETLERVSARLTDVAAAQPAVFEVNVLAAGPPGATTFSGLVVEDGNEPLPGTHVSVFGTSPPVEATTGGDGRFTLTGVTPGPVSLQIAGPIGYPTLPFESYAVSGRENRLAKPIALPRLDLAGARTAGGVTDVDVALSQVDGGRLHVPAGSVRMPDGSHTALVSITQVNQDKLPMQLPGGISPRLDVSIQPSTARFDPPAELVIPNTDALPPGYVTDLYSFDHDLGEYVIRGTATVSEDGSVVRTDPGFGIIKGGWHGPGNPFAPRGNVNGNANDAPPIGPRPGPPKPNEPGSNDPGPNNKPPRPGNEKGRDGQPPDKKKKQTRDTTKANNDGPGPGGDSSKKKDGPPGPHKGGDPIILATGELEVGVTDLFIVGRGFPFELTRTYRSQYDYDGPLGHNWDFSLNESLLLPAASDPAQDVARCGGDARVDLYERQPDGSYRSPGGMYDGLRRNPDGTFTIRARDGFRRTFDAAGLLVARADRFGNTMTFTRDGNGRLTTVTDTLGRDITFSYNTKGRLAAVTDFIGRQVIYTYDDRGDLITVRTPIVVGTSTGNDFPDGKVTRYEYSFGVDEVARPDLAPLNHNLLSITDPKGQRYLVNTYGADPTRYDFDRVLTQQEGRPDQVRTLAYTELNPNPADFDPNRPRNQTIEVDRNGNRRVYTHNDTGQLHELRVETNRDVRPGDPDAFVTTYTYNTDSELLSVVRPEGDSITYVYDSGNPERAQQGNLIGETHHPGPRGGDQTSITTTYAYEPIYNQHRGFTDPRGTDPAYVPPNGGSQSAARYTTTSVFDYQEGNTLPALADEMGRTTADVQSMLTAAGVSLGLGDQNGDGVTDRIAGNVVKLTSPTVRLLAGSQQALIEGGTAQPIVVTYVHNRFGQLTAVTDPAGFVDRTEYWPESDPDGDGIATVSSRTLANDTGGYLKATVEDADGVGIRRETAYDEVGNPIRSTDARGATTSSELNAFNQIVRMVARAPFNYERRVYYDANGNVVREEVQNVDANGPNLGPVVTYTHTYDVLDARLSSTDGISTTTTRTVRYERDSNQHIVRTIFPEGDIEEQTYDERDLVYRWMRGAGTPEASVRTHTYDRNGNLTSVEDAEDQNGDGQPEAVRSSYDGYDRVVRIVDGVGTVTTYAYDPAGNRVRQQLFGTDGGPSPTDATGTGNVLLSEIEARFDEVSRAYQHDEKLFANVATVGPEGSLTPGDGKVTSRTEFDRNSRTTGGVDDNGHTHQIEYDGADRVVRTIDALGNETQHTWDPNGNLVRDVRLEKSPATLVPDETFTSTYEYDALDRRIASTDNLGNRVTTRFDSRDNVIEVRDALGNRTLIMYDGVNRKVAESRELLTGGTGAGDPDTSNATNPDARNTKRYTYDGDDRLVALEDDNGNRTTFTYDALSRKTAERYADGTQLTWAYDRDHNVVRFQDANGSVRMNRYDAANRLVQQDVTRAAAVEGTTQILWEYDGRSRQTRMVDDNDPADGADDSVLEWQWDSLSRLLVEIQNGQHVERTFDGVGNPIARRYPNGRQLTLSYDALDRLTDLRDAGAPSAIAQYDYIGPTRVLEHRYGNGTRLRFHDGAGHVIGYDALQRPVLLRHETTVGTPLSVFDYAYDRLGNRRFEGDLVADRADVYEYDSAYRLTRTAMRAPHSAVAGIVNNTATNADVSAISGTGQQIYQLDGVGNWRSRNGVPRSVNALNQYVSVGPITQTYDANGNLTDDGTNRYVYDYMNRLVRVTTLANVERGRYRYDALGRRIRRDTASGRTLYFHDSQRCVEERDGAGTVLRQYVDGTSIDGHIELRRGDGAPFFYHQNALGNVVALSDASGVVVERYRYDAYGEPTILAPNGTTIRSASTVGNPYTFTGRRLDPESGLYYYRARYLSPGAGRFINRDPHGYSDGLNLYEYAGSNPVNFVDPMGTEKKDAGSGKKPPCPPEVLRHRALTAVWAMAYEENRIGGPEKFISAYGAQDITEHALFGDSSMKDMPAAVSAHIPYADVDVPLEMKPADRIMAEGGRFLPHRNHQIFLPGYGEIDIRWMMQGYMHTDNPWGLEGFGGGVKWIGGQVYSWQYTRENAQQLPGEYWSSYAAAQMFKMDENTQINEKSFELGRQLRSGGLLGTPVGKEYWVRTADGMERRQQVQKNNTLADFARSIGPPPADGAYMQSDKYPPGYLPTKSDGSTPGMSSSRPTVEDDCE